MNSETGFTWPWERCAMRGDMLPGELPLPDQMAYTAMRNIYAAYYRKAIDRARAAAEKRQIMRCYQESVSRMEFEDNLARHRARILRDTEAAKTACRKDPAPENALRLCDVLDGIGERYEGKRMEGARQ